MSKLPYIADKKLYAAVMGACSYVRETGWFNKATEYYADKYGVDVEKVRKYVRMAQGNGQRRAAQKQKRKYKWYVSIVLNDYYQPNGDTGYFYSWDWDEQETLKHTTLDVRKAVSAKNAENSITKTYMSAAEQFELSHWFKLVKHIDEFETEKEARAFADNMTWEYARAYVI